MNNEIDEKIETFVAKTSAPQLNVSIWHKGTHYNASFGSNQQAGVDVFEIGSISKIFTTTLFAILVENGVVNVNDKLDRFRPDLSFAKDISLHQLATHTSGLPKNPFNGIILNSDKALRNFSHADYEGFLNNLNKPVKTGRFKYSNLGVALLGNTLADHIGMSYENAVNEYILTPLGMFDTHISPNAYEANRLAIGHNGKGKAVSHFQWSSMEPAGLWRSTTKDMMVFLRAHLGYSKELWKYLLDKTTQPAFDEPKRKHIGLGWQLSSNKEFGNFAWHNGQTLGQKSVAVCAKSSDSALIILSNKAPKLWHHFFTSYSIEQLSFSILALLSKSK